MDELEKLLKAYKDAWLKYPQEKREIEYKLLDLIVSEITAIKTEMKARRGGRPPKEEAA